MFSNSTVSQEQFANKFRADFESIRKNIAKPNILVIGGTGVGKSSLINLIFRKEIATVGAGHPITRGIQKYDNDLANIFDSEGYETGAENQQHFNQLITDFIEKQSYHINTSINIIWYCISAPAARITALDIALMNELYTVKYIPTSLVLTQIDKATLEQCESIEQVAVNSISSLAVFACSTNPNVHWKQGVEKLFQWSLEKLPEAQKYAFISLANRDLDKKEKYGSNLIMKHVGTAFTTGFVPIPAADAPFLILNQTAMLARLASLWDMPLLKTVLGIGFLESLATFLGTTIACNLIKLIPGLGTVVGGVINGVVAAAITYAIGEAVNKTCRKLCELSLTVDIVNLNDYFGDSFIQLIKEQYINYMKQKNISLAS